MKQLTILAAVLFAFSGAAAAQTSSSGAVGQAASDAGAMAQTGAITFEAADPLRSQRVHTTPNVYAPPSMFGGANNCMGSDTFGVGATGWGFGGSKSSESVNCNTREDTAIWAKLGFMDVAALRFACFGADENRQAFEAAGHACPSSATAEGIEGAPVGPKFLVAPAVVSTMRGRINADGTVTYDQPR